jgi:hypothetical protein
MQHISPGKIRIGVCRVKKSREAVRNMDHSLSTDKAVESLRHGAEEHEREEGAKKGFK